MIPGYDRSVEENRFSSILVISFLTLLLSFLFFIFVLKLFRKDTYAATVCPITSRDTAMSRPPRSSHRRDNGSDNESIDTVSAEIERSMSRLDIAGPSSPSNPSPSNAILRRGSSYRHRDYIPAQNDLADRISNKFLPPEETNLMIKRLEKQ